MTAIAYLDETASGWDRTLYAFLAEKHRRSGSQRTVQAYSRMLNEFFGRAAKTPDQVTSDDAFAWAYGTALAGKEPSSITIAARLACLSSYYRFLIRMKVVGSNPCDAIERPRISPSNPRGLTAGDIRRLLAVITPRPPAGRPGPYCPQPAGGAAAAGLSARRGRTGLPPPGRPVPVGPAPGPGPGLRHARTGRFACA
ncbi:MAG TPA: site-specific integrase [Dehalococcoidia bacterium]|nr:site-specific integrase [Dehalococcoidia bacterium]